MLSCLENLVAFCEEVREEFRSEGIAEEAFKAINEIIISDKSRIENKHLLKSFYRFLGSYVDNLPPLPVTELIEYFEAGMDFFCLPEDGPVEFEPAILDYFKSVLLQNSDKEILRIIEIYKEPLLTKLVRFLDQDDLFAAEKALCMILYLTEIESGRFNIGFEDKGIIESTRRLLKSNKNVLLSNLLNVWANLILRPGKIAITLALDQDLIHSIMQLSQDKPELDEWVVYFFRAFFENSTVREIENFAKENLNIVDFFLAKIRLNEQKSILENVCQILHKLICIGDADKDRISKTENVFAKYINSNKVFMKTIIEATKTNDNEVKLAYENLLISLFYRAA